MLHYIMLTLLLFTPTKDMNIKFLDNEFSCLIETIYFEARNQSEEGQLAVAEVVLNRVRSNKFPNTICKVVKQPHQFSYYSYNKKLVLKNIKAKEKAIKVALKALKKPYNKNDPLLYFHTINTKPYWSEKKTIVMQIQNHYFYTN